MSPLIAVDWGTTNRRTYVIDNGVVMHTERDALGIGVLGRDDYPALIETMRARYGDYPVLLGGMIGSNRGWHEASYVPAPCGLEEVARALYAVGDRVWIVPGISWHDGKHGDVMRGEEVQLLGAAAAGMTPSRTLLCQPGTHCKWAEISEGQIDRFVTAMPGELFALLRSHSLLATQLIGDVTDGAAFSEGVEDARSGDLLARLFGIRAAGILGLRDDAHAPSYASGLLIGADCAAHGAGRNVHLLADETLGLLYARAIEQCGGTVVMVDSHAAFAAGAIKIWELAQ
jgi:2-dehydro-3-deoxygalactonokinase